uniref:Uncharacterized protein n=1 Tax=Cacopsylla melanoneura TaxID=428564 RepID=A0A8D8R1Q4_9HEMI
MVAIHLSIFEALSTLLFPARPDPHFLCALLLLVRPTIVKTFGLFLPEPLLLQLAGLLRVCSGSKLVDSNEWGRCHFISLTPRWVPYTQGDLSQGNRDCRA